MKKVRFFTVVSCTDSETRSPNSKDQRRNFVGSCFGGTRHEGIQFYSHTSLLYFLQYQFQPEIGRVSETLFGFWKKREGGKEGQECKRGICRNLKERFDDAPNYFT